MKTNRLSVILFALICIAVTSVTQKTEVLVLRKSNVKYKRLSNGIFQLIPCSVDTNSLQFVATIQATAKITPYHNLYFLQDQIQNIAQRLGANSYLLNNYQLDNSLNTTSLTLNTFRIPDSLLNAPSITKDTNKIFIFPPILYGKNFKIRFNNENIELGDREYFVYNIKPHETIIVGGGRHMDKLSIYCDSTILSKYIVFDTGLTAIVNPAGAGLIVGKFPILTEDYAKYLMRSYFVHPKTCTYCALKP